MTECPSDERGGAELSPTLEASFLRAIEVLYDAAADPSSCAVSLEALVAGTRALAPHFERAMAIQRKISGLTIASNAAIELLDRLSFGVLLLDQRGRALLTNVAATEILRSEDGLGLAADGRLFASHADSRAKLARLMGEVCGTDDGNRSAIGRTILVRRWSGLRPIALLLMGLRGRTGSGVAPSPVAAAFLTDPERPTEDPRSLLQQLYQFTRAEAGIAWLLFEGRRVSEIAAELSITEETARCHVKRILAKAECRSQSDLIRVLCRGPAGLLSAGDDAVDETTFAGRAPGG